MGFSFNIQTDSMRDYITVKTAAEMSGYNQQYLRRLLRGDILPSKRFGQLWLIERNGFADYVNHAKLSTDKRFGPQISEQ